MHKRSPQKRKYHRNVSRNISRYISRNLQRSLVWTLLLCTLIVTLQSSVWQINAHQTVKPPERIFHLADGLGNATWASQIGLRMASLRAKIPTIDRVVLVPDRETFLETLRNWNLRGRFPILIDDPQYAPKFIRRFQPAEIIRIPAIKSRPQQIVNKQSKSDRNNLLDTVATTWGVTDYKLLANHWQKLGWNPVGVVITFPSDPAAPAAIALAAAWGQPITFLDDFLASSALTNLGKPNDSLDFQTWQTLQAAVEKSVDATGYPYQNLGDAIDTITIARQMAVKYKPNPTAKENYAVTDGLARKADGSRWAIAGWIYGSLEQSIYQAMCSIFLDHQTAVMYDSYPHSAPWWFYDMAPAAANLEKVGFKTTLLATPNTGINQWRELTGDRIATDLLFVNSSGIPTAFAVSGGNAQVEDIPELPIPTAIHFIHSWSAVSPANVNTVAGRWLANGAYAYIGAVDEPYLQAFVPPSTIVARILQSVPFLVASRQYTAPAWKITAIGDPLMLVTPPRKKLSPKDFPL